MVTVWFVALAFMIAMYVVLDGFDLGVGALHRVLARDDDERGQAIALLGPIWDGNEVWLIAGGGVLFLAFPIAYAAAFSGLYLGLILVLWLLIGRGLAIELRGEVEHPLWRTACDTVFWLSSAALAFVFGVALGNVVRGVPLGPDGFFRLDLFGILNAYALLVGLAGLVLLTAHGTAFLAAHADGTLALRARAWASRVWWASVALLAALTAATYAVRHTMLTTFGDHPWRLLVPAVWVAALAATWAWRRAGNWRRAFLASSVSVAALLATAAAGLYPAVLPARDGHPHGLTVHNAASGHHALSVALVWWSVAVVLALAYVALAYRHALRRPAAYGPTNGRR